MASFRLRSRQWITDEQGRIIMGEGRKEILENIRETGSITKTAKKMKMSYKGAWGKIKASEKYLDKRIVNTDRKKGSWLTEEGKDLLRKYTLFKERCMAEENRIFDQIFGNQKT